MVVQDLIRQVKHNSNISDAKFWGYYSPCGFLLSMRELYFHEKNVEPYLSPNNQHIISWIAEREAMWQLIESEDYSNLTIENKEINPFDIKKVNSLLLKEGLLYDGGFGLLKKPIFSLSRIQQRKRIKNIDIWLTQKYICRGLSAPVALSVNNMIILNQDVLNRLLYYKFLDWQSKKSASISDDYFQSFHIAKGEKPSAELFEKIKKMAESAEDILISHEMGEIHEGSQDDNWKEIIFDSQDRVTEFNLRAIQDILADTSEMGALRLIAERRDMLLLTAYIVLMDEMRRKLFPEIILAYDELKKDGKWQKINMVRKTGYQNATALKKRIAKSYLKRKQIKDIKKIIEKYGVR
jgi:hypothetical protein